MRHLVYKITNKINGKIYIGKFSGTNFNDYWGSGLLIKRAIRKYGRCNFIKDVLFEFTSEQEAWAKEAELVNPETISGGGMYNLATGGANGGAKFMVAMWKDPNSIMNSPEFLERRKASQKRAKNTPESKSKTGRRTKRLWDDPDSAFNSPSRNKKIGDANRANHRDPNSTYNTPEYLDNRRKSLYGEESRKKNSDSHKKLWDDPNSKYHTGKLATKEFRATLSSTVTAWWKKRKEKQCLIAK